MPKIYRFFETESKMKKFFAALVVFIFVSCGSDKTTGERLPYSEITDEDIVNSEPETTDEESADEETDSDADVTENDDTDPVPLGNLCTEQDKCYYWYGSSAIDCPAEGEKFYGQDAQYAELGCIHHSFTVREVDGGGDIVIDNNTGLIWQPEDRKKSYPYFEQYTWQEANDKCAALNDSNYAGYSDWRLPTPMELLTISENDDINPAFNIVNIAYSDPNLNRERRCLWSSKKYDTDSVYCFNPLSGYGGMSTAFMTSNLEALCVRGDKLPNGFFTETTENGKNVVIDSTTGLMWQKVYASYTKWSEALYHCQNLNSNNYAGYKDWRLPNKNELASLLNYDKSSAPYSGFPRISGKFWSSTTRLTVYNDMAWCIDFDSGTTASNSKESLDIMMRVRCVR